MFPYVKLVCRHISLVKISVFMLVITVLKKKGSIIAHSVDKFKDKQFAYVIRQTSQY